MAGRRQGAGNGHPLPATRRSLFDIATVVDALRRIVDGETMIDPTIVAHLLGTAPAGRPARRPQPSENERSWG